MLEQVQEYLRNKYEAEINRYNTLKAEMDDLEKKIAEDDSEKRYQSDIKSLNKKYSFFNRGKEYKKEKKQIEDGYHNELLKFKEIYDNYLKIRHEVIKIDYYGRKKRLEKVNKSKSLKDLRLNDQTARLVLEGKRDIY